MYCHEDSDNEVMIWWKLRRIKGYVISAHPPTRDNCYTDVCVREMVQRMDSNKDGQVSKEEMDLWLQKVQDNTYRKEGVFLFKKEDRNEDGIITFNEYWMNEQGDGT